jgi:hypothetical protein
MERGNKRVFVKKSKGLRGLPDLRKRSEQDPFTSISQGKRPASRAVKTREVKKSTRVHMCPKAKKGQYGVQQFRTRVN